MSFLCALPLVMQFPVGNQTAHSTEETERGIRWSTYTDALWAYIVGRHIPVSLLPSILLLLLLHLLLSLISLPHSPYSHPSLPHLTFLKLLPILQVNCQWTQYQESHMQWSREQLPVHSTTSLPSLILNSLWMMDIDICNKFKTLLQQYYCRAP